MIRLILLLWAVTTILRAELILVDPKDTRDLDLSVGSNVRVYLLSLDFGQSSINIEGDGYPNFGSSVSQFSVTAFSQGGPISDAFCNKGVFYTDDNGFKSGAATGLNYARIDIDGEFEPDNTLTYELVLEFDTKDTPDSSDDVITRYVYAETGTSLDVPEALSLFFPTVGGQQFPETQVLSTSINETGGIRLIWGSPLSSDASFSLWTSSDLSLPIEQWFEITDSMDYLGPNQLNTFDTEPIDSEEPQMFFIIRSEK